MEFWWQSFFLFTYTSYFKMFKIDSTSVNYVLESFEFYLSLYLCNFVHMTNNSCKLKSL